MKVLIIRFSSIGDIVLTTPVIRCVSRQLKDVELHYLCKEAFVSMLTSNPYIQQLHVFDKNDTGIIQKLKAENFDYIIDLQNNRHSLTLCKRMGVPFKTFPKLNIKKWVLVNFKINLMPDLHVVDRYFVAVSDLGISNDKKGLDFFLAEEDYAKMEVYNLPEKFIVVAIGSKHATKQIPKEKLLEICRNVSLPLVFLGDKKDAQTSLYIKERLDKTSYDFCGKLSIRMSAVCIAKSTCLLTGDTGLMHIGAALRKPLVTVWGNTVPAFGMYPYMPLNEDKYVIFENNRLRCRPCSKLGYKRCPYFHFKCMRTLNVDEVVFSLNKTAYVASTRD